MKLDRKIKSTKVN